MIGKLEIRSTKSETKFKYLSFGISKLISHFALIASCLLVLAPHALAAESGFVALAPIPGLTDISPTALVQSDSLANFFNNLYKYLIGLAAILAIIEIIWGGIEISTQDSVSKKTDGKQRIYNALFGLVLVLSPAIVFSVINPRILDLSIGLSPLNLPAPTQNTSATPPGGYTANPLPEQTYPGQTPVFSQPLPAGSGELKPDGTCNAGNALVTCENKCYPIRIPTGTGTGFLGSPCADKYILSGGPTGGFCRLNPGLFDCDLKFFY